MKLRISLLLAFFILIGTSIFAQEATTPKTKNKDKADFATFKKQMMGLQEYIDERKKIPKLQKQNKATVKVYVVVTKDSTADADDETQNNILNGFIRQDIGDNSFNVYEVEFDRVTKKITSVKATGEGLDPDTDVKKATHQKKGSDDDGDDDDEKPSHKKDKDDE